MVPYDGKGAHVLKNYGGHAVTVMGCLVDSHVLFVEGSLCSELEASHAPTSLQGGLYPV